MKHFLFLVITLFSTSLLYISCGAGSGADQKQENALENEILAIHDKLMPMVTKMNSLKDSLVRIDSLKSTSDSLKLKIDTLIKNSEHLDEDMSFWMNDYSTERKGGHEEVMKYLHLQRDKILSIEKRVKNHLDSVNTLRNKLKQ